MAKKNIHQAVSEHIDFERGILYGALKQIRSDSHHSSDNNTPALIKTWCCEISPSQTKNLVSIIRYNITPEDLNPLIHIKRINKGVSRFDEDRHVLKVIVCTTEYCESEVDLIRLLDAHKMPSVDTIKAYTIDIPKYAPQTKELSQEWSTAFWPMSWKGNPNHQYLNSLQIEIESERFMIRKLVEEFTNLSKSELSNSLVAIVARETPGFKKEILTIASNNGSSSPLDHSILKAIDNISTMEKHRRSSMEEVPSSSSNYLCHNLLVYTTHEPCVMCCMALVHSRIGRIVFLKEVASTGGLESNYQLGDMDGLNWKFDIFKWISKHETDQFDTLQGHMRPLNLNF